VPWANIGTMRREAVGSCAIAALLAGCGFTVRTDGASTDGGPGDDSHGDGGEPDAAPQPLGPFSMPTVIPALANAAVDDDPTVTGDLCELYYSTLRSGNEDIWVSRRSSAMQPWGAPSLVPELSTPSIDTTPEVSADGLTIYLARANNLLVSTRADRNAAWTPPTPVTELNTGSLEGSSAPTASHLTMVFASSRAGGGGDIDVWLATRGAVGDPWSNVTALNELNTAGLDTTPFLAESHQLLIYASDRGGGSDSAIYTSERSGPGAMFEAPQAIVELGGPGEAMDPWIAEDLRYVVFASDRSGNWEIYEASR
jgi:Tol biopolymer transport system component